MGAIRVCDMAGGTARHLKIAGRRASVWALFGAILHAGPHSGCGAVRPLDRLKRLCQARGLAGPRWPRACRIKRNSLRSHESGDPAAAIGICPRAMLVLGIIGELLPLAGDTSTPQPAGSAAARSCHAVPVLLARVL